MQCACLLASDGFCKVEVDFERGQDERELRGIEVGGNWVSIWEWEWEG